ncbi:DUF6093 family protein [Micromonospora sp. LOL_014]|uniref:DUF6093 family protein n=1 Tax=Micromonospora sp. LOL_014 TaxID=3345415 RepID=UPI003A8971FC
MSVASALAAGRRAAEALMVDSCVIRRRVGESTSPDTGVVTPTYSTIYSGACRVQQPGAQARPVDAAEDYALMLRLEVQLPVVGSEGVRAEDEVVLGAGALDADLTGRVLVVRDLAHKSHATSRRLGCEERTS